MRLPNMLLESSLFPGFEERLTSNLFFCAIQNNCGINFLELLKIFPIFSKCTHNI